MKIGENKLFVLIVFLSGVFADCATLLAQTPPVPASPRTPPPPDGLPIDDSVFILIVIALLFGIYIIYNHKIKAKAPK